MNTYEYWYHGINCIVVFSRHINGHVFSIVLLNYLLICLMWNDNILFCSVWFLLPARFEEYVLLNKTQTLKMNNISAIV